LLALTFACGGSSPAGETATSAGEPARTPPPGQPAAQSVGLERLDPAAECDGLLPERAPEPIHLMLAPPAGHVCAGGTSDGTGYVALAAQGGGGASWQVHGAGGEPLGMFSAWPAFPAPVGWHGLVVERAGDGGGSLVAHAAFQPGGALLASYPVSRDPALTVTHRWSLAQDPLGGCLAVVAQTDLLHNHWAGLRAQRFDAAGAPRWREPAEFGWRSDPTVFFLAAGMSRRGEALALWQHSAFVDVTWLDAAGATAAAGDRVERSAAVLGSDALEHAIELVPLLDGGLAVRADGAFRRVYPHLSTTSAPLPAWLARRATWSLRFTRGNQGYALLPPPGAASADCSQSIELLAPSGRLCGRVTLMGDGEACATGIVDQGWDGTVVQQRTQDGCSYRSWRGLLAR
jgi:hypothetical protein